MRVAGGDDKLNVDLVRLVKINCTCAGDSFEGTCFVCWQSRDRVSILPRSCVDFIQSAQTEIVCRFHQDRGSILPDVHWSSAQIWKIFTEVENCRKTGDKIH